LFSLSPLFVPSLRVVKCGDDCYDDGRPGSCNESYDDLDVNISDSTTLLAWKNLYARTSNICISIERRIAVTVEWVPTIAINYRAVFILAPINVIKCKLIPAARHFFR
jgi:hypothetical protein